MVIQRRQEGTLLFKKGGGLMEDYIVIYRSFITVKGKRIYARNHGLKAFPLKVRKGRYTKRKKR